MRRRIDEPLMVYTHVPKTGGMTMRSVLKLQYLERNTIRHSGSIHNTDTQLTAVARANPGTRAIAGHFLPGVDDALGRASRSVTLLRDPVARVKSHYFHARRHQGADRRVHHVEATEYIRARDNWHNLQTRIFASRFGEPLRPAEDVDGDTLEQAKRTLEGYEVVGITERFDESLLLMARRLGWRKPFYRKRNVNPSPVAYSTLPAAITTVIEEHSAFDIELYRWASARFEEDIRAQGRTFSLAVAAFPTINRAAMPIAEGLVAIRRRILPVAM